MLKISGNSVDLGNGLTGIRFTFDNSRKKLIRDYLLQHHTTDIFIFSSSSIATRPLVSSQIEILATSRTRNAGNIQTAP